MTDREFHICEFPGQIDGVAAANDLVCLETDGAIHGFGATDMDRESLAPAAHTHVLTLEGEVWTLDAMGRVVALGDQGVRRAGDGRVVARPVTLPVSLPGPADAVAAAPQGEALLAVCGVAVDSDIERAQVVEVGETGAVRTFDLESTGQIEVQPFARGFAALVCDVGRVWHLTGGGVGHLGFDAEDAHSLRPAATSDRLALIRVDNDGCGRIAVGTVKNGAWTWRDLPLAADIDIADFAWRGAHPELVLSATRGGRGHMMVVALDGSVLRETALPAPWLTECIAVAPDGLRVHAVCGNLVAVWKVAAP